MTDAPFDEPEPPEPDFAPPEPVTAAHVPVPAEPPTPPARILELNQQALAYYTSLFGRSWAPDYLRERLGTDLVDDPRFTVGYAPPGPSSLIRQLTTGGATAEELVDAGLARVNDRGRLVDAFRDRIVFPIYAGSDLVGFIGRRNPTKADNEYAGPKYLNTRGTAVFTKGDHLYGLIEGAADLAAGSTPVLVEGPMDAIAVTLATNGACVGVAPLGTAFTEAQAQRLKPYLRDEPNRIVIATDPDSAGWLSAQRAFWQLAALRAIPRRLALPDGVDPADVLRTEGAGALADRLAGAEDFAGALIDRFVAERLDQHSDTASRIWLGRDLARIVGALPPEQWLERSEQVAERLDLPLAVVQQEVMDAGTLWTEDPRGCAARELAVLRPAASTQRVKVVQPHPQPESIDALDPGRDRGRGPSATRAP